MTAIQTFKGRRFDLAYPRAEHVDFDEIAHALSQLCRWNGHTREFYSVAEHSCRVADACPNYRDYALLHDGKETYLGDWITPVKQALPMYATDQLDTDCVERAMNAIEDQIDAAIYRAAGLTYPVPPEIAALVKHADLQLLETEKRDLMSPAMFAWTTGVAPLEKTIRPWSPARAEREFQNRFARHVTSFVRRVA